MPDYPGGNVLRKGGDGHFVVRTGTYLLPDPVASLEEWGIFSGFDLAGADELVIWSEEQLASHALATLLSSRADTVIFRDERGQETWATEWLKSRIRLCRSERVRIKQQAQL